MPACNAKPGARRAFIRKKRPDGSTYHVPALLGGERCTEFAVVSWFDGSKTERRCIEHLRWKPDDPRADVVG